MTDLVSNGTFQTGADDWDLGAAPFEADWLTEGHLTPGAVQILAGCTIEQQISALATATPTQAILRFSYRLDSAAALDPLTVKILYTDPDITFQITDADTDVWNRHKVELLIAYDGLGTDPILRLYTGLGTSWTVDDISLQTSLDVDEFDVLGDCNRLRWELMKRRQDHTALKHPARRYLDILNEVIGQAPMALWRRDVDTSLTTVASTRRYSLAALTAITSTRQIRAVSIETGQGHQAEIGRWQIEDDLGTLTLILDQDPPAADRTIRLDYLRPHSSLACESDTADQNTLDEQWLLARAMTLLLLEADPALEHPDPAVGLRLLDAATQRWDAIRQAREAELLTGPNRLPATKARSKRRGF